MSVYITAFTAQGIALAQRIATAHDGVLMVPKRLGEKLGLPCYDGLDGWTATHFVQGNTLVFVGACGIAVRAIAPYVQDKFTDPAVVVVDELGQVVIPLLSGHVGGGNAMAVAMAQTLNAVAAVGTATDLQGKIAIDIWAKTQGYTLSDRTLAKAVSARVLEGESIALHSQFPMETPLPEGMHWGGEGIPVHITASTQPVECLRLIPQVLCVGIGCRRGKSEAEIQGAVTQVLAQAALDSRAIASVGSVDLKADEPGLLAFCKAHGLPFVTFNAAQLEAVEGVFTPSEFVSTITGVDNVCERSAVAQGGKLLVKKQAINGVTVAVAMDLHRQP